MILVGSFKSLQTVLGKPRFTGAPLDVHTWVRSEIALISPLADWLMNLSQLVTVRPPPGGYVQTRLC
jgi:hypothetical protein